MYILLDLETGGLDYQKNPILQGFFMAADEKLNIVSEYEFYIKPSTIPAHLKNIEKEALAINNLSEEELEKTGIPFDEALKKLSEFVSQFSKPIPLGYNVGFDLAFLKHQMGSLYPNFSKQFVDIYSLVSFLKMANLLPESIGTLASLGRHLQISTPNDLHNAKADVYFLRLCVIKLIEELNIRTSNVFGLNPNDTDAVLQNIFL